MVIEWKTGTENVHSDKGIYWGSSCTGVCSDWWSGKFFTCTAVHPNRHFTNKFSKSGKYSVCKNWAVSKVKWLMFSAVS